MRRPRAAALPGAAPVAVLAAAVLVGACSAGALAASVPGPTVAGCPAFPAGNAWNTRVDALPVARDSATLIASIGLGRGLHADFGSGLWDGAPIGIPVTVVGSATPRVRVTFDYADESDRVAYPIPAAVRIEGGSDHHAILVDRAACRLYELYALRREAGRWAAGSGAVWSLRSNALRPRGWTSADAAGLPILPGLARPEEALSAGGIRHALRFTAPRTRRAFIPPARHFASSSTDPALPPMGLRMRLRASYPVASLPPQARAVARALQRYGMILTDNGSPWYVSGVPDARWSNDDLHALSRITGADLQVVATGPGA